MSEVICWALGTAVFLAFMLVAMAKVAADIGNDATGDARPLRLEDFSKPEMRRRWPLTFVRLRFADIPEDRSAHDVFEEIRIGLELFLGRQIPINESPYIALDEAEKALQDEIGRRY